MPRDRESAVVELSIGGRRLRVVATAGSDELEALAADVDARADKIGGRGRAPADVLALVALELAHELRDARLERADWLSRASDRVGAAVRALDRAVGESGRHASLIEEVRSAIADLRAAALADAARRAGQTAAGHQVEASGPGSGSAGSGTAGSGTAGSGTAGSGTAGSGTAGLRPDPRSSAGSDLGAPTTRAAKRGGGTRVSKGASS